MFLTLTKKVGKGKRFTRHTLWNSWNPFALPTTFSNRLAANAKQQEPVEWETSPRRYKIFNNIPRKIFESWKANQTTEQRSYRPRFDRYIVKDFGETAEKRFRINDASQKERCHRSWIMRGCTRTFALAKAIVFVCWRLSVAPTHKNKFDFSQAKRKSSSCIQRCEQFIKVQQVNFCCIA